MPCSISYAKSNNSKRNGKGTLFSIPWNLPEVLSFPRLISGLWKLNRGWIAKLAGKPPFQDFTSIRSDIFWACKCCILSCCSCNVSSSLVRSRITYSLRSYSIDKGNRGLMIGTKRHKLLKLNRKTNISLLKDLFDSYVRFETPDNDEWLNLSMKTYLLQNVTGVYYFKWNDWFV